MVEIFGFLVALYVSVTIVFSTARMIKIIDLYKEFQIVRAREHKIHIKSHAQHLMSEFRSDLVWPIFLYGGFRSAVAWIREK